MTRVLVTLAVVGYAGFASAAAAPAMYGIPACSSACVERVKARDYARTHGGCRSPACTRRVERKRWARVVAPHRAFFERVARCESGGRWHINTGNGYSGGIQFAPSSWRAVGGQGYAHEASKLEQMYRGVLLLRLQGPGAWPVCSR